MHLALMNSTEDQSLTLQCSAYGGSDQEQPAPQVQALVYTPSYFILDLTLQRLLWQPMPATTYLKCYPVDGLSLTSDNALSLKELLLFQYQKSTELSYSKLSSGDQVQRLVNYHPTLLLELLVQLVESTKSQKKCWMKTSLLRLRPYHSWTT